MFCLSYLLFLVGIVCLLVLFVVVMLGVLLDRTGFGLVWFVFICGCNVGCSA